MYKDGETVRFEGKFTSLTGTALTGATVTVNLYNPAGSLIVSGGSASEAAGGRYYYDYAVNAAGDWYADFSTTNTNADLLSVSDMRRVVATDYFETDVSALATAAIAIQAKTDNLPADPASETTVLSRLAAASYTAPDNATIAAIDGKADEILEDIYDLTHIDDEPVSRVIPPPESSDACVVYEYCYDQASGTPLASVTATARIVRLPYDYADKLHSKSEVAGTYVAATGLCSWEIAQGATVEISIPEVGLLAEIVVPNEIQARIADLLEEEEGEE